MMKKESPNLVEILPELPISQRRILLHICCGPCSCAPLERLRYSKWEVTGYWNNPNIEPPAEYARRLESMKTAANYFGVPVIADTDIDTIGWDSARRGSGTSMEFPTRCIGCYTWRLDKAAATARENDFTYFSTTLLYSKYQNHEMIRSAGYAAMHKYNVQFLDIPFMTGWGRGIRLSKKIGLYRQKYCGCILSQQQTTAVL